MVLFESPRRFSIHSYQHSHGPLLLRSPPADEEATQIDVLIKDVRALELRCWFDGIKIDLADAEYLSAFRSRPHDLIEPGNVAYRVLGNGWEGFVIGGRFITKEYRGHWSGPSPLIGEDAD